MAPVMPNITRGDRMDNLMRYLVGKGRRNEHESPHLVNGSPSIMAWHMDRVLSLGDSQQIAAELDGPHQAFGVEPHGGYVWHCSLSVKAEEGELGDEKWGEIAAAFMERMGFLVDGKAPVRWAAVHHGKTISGNDHIHLAVDLVREDGTKASTWMDQPKAQAAAAAIEKQFGLQQVESRGAGIGERGRKQPAWAQARADKAVETYDERLERIIRAVASTSDSEGEFVRGLRKAGLLTRPFWEKGGEEIAAGYSVAARPPKGQRPVYKGGGKLARDLTLPALRDGWKDGQTEEAKRAAAGEWDAARRNKRMTVRSPRSEPRMDPETWIRWSQEMSSLRGQLDAVPAGDTATWAGIAHQLSGVFSAWSLGAEGERGGPLQRAASTLARTAQVRRQHDQTATKAAWGPSVRGASQLIASAAREGQGVVGQTVLLRQLTNTMKALHDAHEAAGRAGEARRIANAVMTDLEQVRQSLPSRELRELADQRAAEAGQLVGGGRPVAPGSPVPAHLQAHRVNERTHTGGRER